MRNSTKIALSTLTLAAAVSAALAQGVSPAAALAKLGSKVYSTGPNGEQPASASSVTLTPAEIAKVKAMKATAAIVLHYGGNDWSNAQVDGLKARFAELGVTVIAVTDAGFKPEKQVSDLETVSARKPSVIVSIPTDPVATASEYKKVAAAGIKLVFMDNVPKGMTAGKDYTSVVSSDNYGNGIASAHLMAQALGSKGNIGIIYHSADFFVTKQRYEAFKATIKQYPGIKVVAEQGIGGPDFAGDAEKVANAMLTRNPTLSGIWAVWDVPAEGVLSAARTAGRKDLIVATMDLGKNVALEMAKPNGLIKGLGAQRPYEAGVTEANLAAYALLGKKAPAYVALPALPVTRSTLGAGWKAVYNQTLPSDVNGVLSQK